MNETSQITKFKYNAQHKPKQLICGYGQIVVVTGWTLSKSVEKHLQKEDFAAIGQLYSPTRGINLLIRNLLANPHVRYLVALNATREDKNAGAIECLLDFFRNGYKQGRCDTGKDCWVINSDFRGYIDLNIKAEYLEKLKNSLIWEEVKSISEAVKLVKHFHSYPLEVWGSSPKLEEIPIVSPNILPGRRYGHRIEGKTIAETWVKIIHLIKTTGTIRPTSHDGQWQELIDVMAIVTDEPDNFYFPEPNYLPIDKNFLQEYISQIMHDASQQEGVKYTYGQRLISHFNNINQIEKVINQLLKDIDTARGVMSLWDATIDSNDNPPCLNHIWVRVIENQLSLTATFRSNDMFSAWCANAMGLRALQKHIKEAINHNSNYNLELGSLITISQSAHIYDDCWENADNVIKSQYPKICKARDYADASGSFVITVQEELIVVEHMTSGSGEIVNCYSGKTAKQLYQEISIDCPALETEHAMYLGTELQKAEFAILSKQEFLYEQDKPFYRVRR
jgi:thymidylate synthase